jgi:hypothetical protein
MKGKRKANYIIRFCGVDTDGKVQQNEHEHNFQSERLTLFLQVTFLNYGEYIITWKVICFVTIVDNRLSH